MSSAFILMFHSSLAHEQYRMDTHESGAMVIASLHGFLLNGRPLRVSWGKERYRRPSTANASISPVSRLMMITQGGLSSPPRSHLSPIGIAGHSGLTTLSHYSPLSPQEVSGSPSNSLQAPVNYSAYHGYLVPAYGGYYGFAAGPRHSGYSSPSHHHPQHMGGMTSHMGHSFAASGYGPQPSIYEGSPSMSGKALSGTTTAASNSPPAPSSPSTLEK